MKRATFAVGLSSFGVAISAAFTRLRRSAVSATVLAVLACAFPLSAQHLAATVSIPDGGPPTGIAFAGGHIYITDGDSSSSTGTVWVFDPQGKIETGIGGYKSIAANPATGLVYIANQGAGSVTVIDSSTNKVVRNISVPGDPTGIAVNTATNEIWVSSQAVDTLYVIDGVSGSLENIAIPAAGVPGSVSADRTRNRVYMTSDHDTVVIDGASKAVVSRILGVTGIVADPDGSYLYGVEVDNAAAIVLDATTYAAQPNTLPHLLPTAIGVGQGLVLVAYDSTPSTISVFSHDTSEELARLQIGNGADSVAIASDPASGALFGYVVNAVDRTYSVIDLTPAVTCAPLSSYVADYSGGSSSCGPGSGPCQLGEAIGFSSVVFGRYPFCFEDDEHTYSWNFGDGATATGASAQHAYSASGTYTVTLTVGKGELTHDQQMTVTVSSPPPPSQCATMSYVNTVLAMFDASGACSSQNPRCMESDALTFAVVPFGYQFCSGTSFAWNFGDGTTGTGQSITHTFTRAGTYIITATITNSEQVYTTSIAVVISPPTRHRGVEPR